MRDSPFLGGNGFDGLQPARGFDSRALHFRCHGANPGLLSSFALTPRGRKEHGTGSRAHSGDHDPHKDVAIDGMDETSMP